LHPTRHKLTSIHPNHAMCAHPPLVDPDRMADDTQATGDHEPQRYEIRVRGPIGPTIMQAFPTLAASRTGQDTLLSGSLPDQSALYGVIHQLEALGLQLLAIRPLPVSGPGDPAQSHDSCEDSSSGPT
jgi:hypothetical protein